MRSLLVGVSLAILLCGQIIASPSSPRQMKYSITGTGYVTDASHPNHPGDFRRYELEMLLKIDLERSEADMEISWEENGKRQSDHYYLRSDNLFQVDDSQRVKPTEPLGDISDATIAALHPAFVEAALIRHQASVAETGNSVTLLAWHDQLWSIEREKMTYRISVLSRKCYHDLYGDGQELVRYFWNQSNQTAIDSVTVESYGRQTLMFSFGQPQSLDSLILPRGPDVPGNMAVLTPDDIQFKEIASHLYAVDLPTLNSRVFVAEFADFLAVIEGAYNSRNGDLIANCVASRFDKPVRYFAFSHLHGQYVGGVRSWIHAGATILVPPTTVPMIETIASSVHSLRPDDLSRDPKGPKIESIKENRTIEDAANKLTIFNVESGHTDEYFIFYFPEQEILLTGDLLFYRPGKPLTGRSKQLCETVDRLGLEISSCYVTWPLDGYGTKNVVSGEEFTAGCRP